MSSLAIPLIWAACILARLVRGRAYVMPETPERVLVVQMAKLGDMVCTTPLFRALKTAHPRARLSVMGSAINHEVLEHNTDIDEYVVFGSLWSALRTMRAGHYSVAIIVTPDIVSSALAYLAGIPAVVVPKVVNGHSPFESFWYRSLRSWCGMRVVPHRMGHYAPGEYLSLLRPMGIETVDTSKHLGFSAGAQQKVERLFSEVPAGLIRVGFAPSAGNKAKIWGSKRFAAVANRLAKEHPVCIVVFGGERDRQETQEMLDALESVPLLDLSFKLSIDELKAAVAQLDMLVAPDTGPIYIAEAFGVPTVDVVGPVHENEQPPQGPMTERVVPPGPRVPQMRIMNVREYDLEETRRQLDATTAESVYGACERLLLKLKA